MEDFGIRLKEERTRLGFSQSKFATACGVGKTAQFNYESDARIPDGEYLSRAGALGVDVGYLMSGERTSSNSVYPLAISSLMPHLAKKAGFDALAMNWAIAMIAESEVQFFSNKGLKLSESDIVFLVDEIFDSGGLLAQITIELHQYLSAHEIHLLPEKEYPLVMMLLRAFKANGKIDKIMMEDFIKLATT